MRTPRLSECDNPSLDTSPPPAVSARATTLLAVQALAVWKLARRDKALSAKVFRLAGTPCSYQPVTIQFSVNNSNNAGACGCVRGLGQPQSELTWPCPNTKREHVAPACVARTTTRRP
jgi:hypothetical protein